MGMQQTVLHRMVRGGEDGQTGEQTEVRELAKHDPGGRASSGSTCMNFSRDTQRS